MLSMLPRVRCGKHESHTVILDRRVILIHRLLILRDNADLIINFIGDTLA